jgi:hypothetical protein
MQLNIASYQEVMLPLTMTEMKEARNWGFDGAKHLCDLKVEFSLL